MKEIKELTGLPKGSGMSSDNDPYADMLNDMLAWYTMSRFYYNLKSEKEKVRLWHGYFKAMESKDF